MTNYREILRLQSLGMNKQETAASVGCSRNTVAEVLRRAKEKGLKYPLPPGMTDVMCKLCMIKQKHLPSFVHKKEWEVGPAYV